MMTGSLSKKKKKKGGCSVIRACSLIRSNTVHALVQVVCFSLFQHWRVYVEMNEFFILVPALLGLKGNLEMTLASRLSTQVPTPIPSSINNSIIHCKCNTGVLIYKLPYVPASGPIIIWLFQRFLITTTSSIIHYQVFLQNILDNLPFMLLLQLFFSLLL